MNDFILLTVAILPTIILSVYIYKKDRAEKEPVRLLLLLFILGAVACYPAGILESLLESFISVILTPFGFKDYYYSVPFNSGINVFYHVLHNFCVIAFVEEALKWIVLQLVANNTKNFNSLFDGIIYAVFVSLGFATLENVLYSFSYGIDVAILRALTAVPGHVFDGVLMGYYFSFYHIKGLADKNEALLRRAGIIPNGDAHFRSGRDLLLSLFVPVVAHGFYDFSCASDSSLFTVSFVLFLAFLYLFCFKKIRQISDLDMCDQVIAVSMLSKQHESVRLLVEELRLYLKEINPEEAYSRITFDDLYRYINLKQEQEAVSAVSEE